MSDVTPSRQQYLDFKAQFPHAIVMFRLGDFYEMFDHDAETAARELDLVLTSRPVKKGERVPMCGVPHHAMETYLARLVEKGYHVAVVEQVGNEPVGGLTPREVSRVVTPGTVMDPGMLADTRHNYLLALAPEPDRNGDGWAAVGLAYVDISTGDFAATQLDGDEAPLGVVEELARLEPREVLLPASWAERGVTLPADTHPTPLADYRFEHGAARQALLDLFEVSTLAGFGLQDKPLAVRAAGAIVAYLRETQRGALDQLVGLHSYSDGQLHDVGRGHAPQPRIDRNHPLAQQARRAAGRAGSHRYADGRAAAAYLDRPADSGSCPAGSAAGRRRSVLRLPGRRGPPCAKRCTE